MDFGDGICLSQKLSQVYLETRGYSSGRIDVAAESDSHERASMAEDVSDVLCSQDLFCTPDYITPVDAQFSMDLEGNKEHGMYQVTPVGLTPVRCKRPRAEVMMTLMPNWPTPPQPLSSGDLRHSRDMDAFNIKCPLDLRQPLETLPSHTIDLLPAPSPSAGSRPMSAHLQLAADEARGTSQLTNSQSRDGLRRGNGFTQILPLQVQPAQQQQQQQRSPLSDAPTRSQHKKTHSHEPQEEVKPSHLSFLHRPLPDPGPGSAPPAPASGPIAPVPAQASQPGRVLVSGTCASRGPGAGAATACANKLYIPANSRARLHALRKRVMSPPCIRNPFVAEAGEGEDDVGKPGGGGGGGDASARMRFPPFRGPSTSGSLPSSALQSRYREEFHEIQEIGRGNFSRVHKVQQRIDGCLYAIKRTLRQLHQDSERRRALTEVQALAAAGVHQNVLRYFTAWYESDHLYIQTKLCTGNVLRSRPAGEGFPEDECVDFLLQVARALAFIHARGIVHLDVKPENIYTTSGGTLKLGDFGRATRADGSLSVIEGDARYMPLEMLNDDLSDLPKVDMFSLGASAYELAKGGPPPASGTSFQAMRQGKLVLLPSFSGQFQLLLKALLHPDPHMRPTASQLLMHPLLVKQAGQL
eukprot:jgi/Mesen1/4518/ME000023S03895